MDEQIKAMLKNKLEHKQHMFFSMKQHNSLYSYEQKVNVNKLYKK